MPPEGRQEDMTGLAMAGHTHHFRGRLGLHRGKIHALRALLECDRRWLYLHNIKNQRTELINHRPADKERIGAERMCARVPMVVSEVVFRKPHQNGPWSDLPKHIAHARHPSLTQLRDDNIETISGEIEKLAEHVPRKSEIREINVAINRLKNRRCPQETVVATGVHRIEPIR